MPPRSLHQQDQFEGRADDDRAAPPGEEMGDPFLDVAADEYQLITPEAPLPCFALSLGSVEATTYHVGRVAFGRNRPHQQSGGSAGVPRGDRTGTVRIEEVTP
ncbi:hypothetical protein ACWD4G_26320 [Streptomyces sp. NPDC002643]